MNQSNILYLIYVVNNFVGLFICIRFFNCILSKKPIPKIRKGAELFLILILAIVLNSLAEYIGDSIIFAVTIYFFVSHLYFEGRLYIKAIASVFVVIFSIVTELLTGILISMVFKQQLLHIRENLLYLFLGGIVSKIMLMVLVEFAIRIKNKNASYVSLGSWFLILSIPVISIYLSVISVYDPIIQNKYNFTSIFTCLAILYINVTTFYLFDNIVSKVFENNQYKLKEKQLVMQQEQYKNILSGYDQVKKIRHDMKNHLIILDSYMSDGQYDQALNYVNKLGEELDLSKKGLISNNIIVDALINNSIEKARKKNIEFNHNIQIPSHLQIDDMDLCIVLGNILDNAIEACERIADDNNRKAIDIEIKYHNQYILVDAKNTYNSKSITRIHGKFLSSKGYRKGKIVGIGLGNIQNIVVMYGGINQIDLMGNIFCYKIMIPDKKVDKQSK